MEKKQKLPARKESAKHAYKGESLVTVTQNIFRRFLDCKRGFPKSGLRKEIVKRQDNECRLCQCSLKDNDLDLHHEKPVAAGGNDDDLIAVCTACHD